MTKLCFIVLALSLPIACGGPNPGPTPDGTCTGAQKVVLGTGVVANVRSLMGEGSLLTQDASHLYWLDDKAGTSAPGIMPKSGAIKRLAKAGGTLEDVFVGAADKPLVRAVATPSGIVVLYLANNASGVFLGKLSADRTSITPLGPSRTQGFEPLTTYFAGVEGDDVLIMTGGDDDASDTTPRLVRVNAASGAETVIYDDSRRPAGRSSPVASLQQVSRQGSDYYFTAAQGAAGLWRIAADGSGQASVVTSENLAARQVLVGGGYIFVGVLSTTRYALDFSSPTVLLDGIKVYETKAWPLLIDGSDVIVAGLDKEGRPAARVAIAGGEPRTIVCDGIGYDSMIADATSFYWIDGDPNSGTRAIAKAPR